jgi:predicted MFS family arabinose efflux permease
MGVFGFGGLAGGAIGLRWKPDRPLVATFSVLLAAPLTLLAVSFAPPLLIFAAVLAVMAVAISLTNTFWHTTLQQQVPPHSISRVSSYDWMVSLLIFPVGASIAGPLADAVGPELTLYVFAALAGLPVAAVLGLRSVRAVRREDHAPTEPMEPPAVAALPELEGRQVRDVA